MSSTQVTSLLCLMLGALPVVAQQNPRVMESYGKLPLSFEANQGQTDRSVKFLSRGSGYTLFLTEDSAVLSLHGKKANAALRMKLLGANAHPAITGVNGLPGKSNYFAGNDPKQWRTNIPTYASVKYTGVYPGIDLVYHGNQRLLEYDFVVAPGADPGAIDLRFQGAKKLSVNHAGTLVVGIGDSEVIEHAPLVYQEISGQRQTVACRYVLRGKGRVGFSPAKYDRSRPLVIDPTLVYSTFLGATSGVALAVDAMGNAYVAGSAIFPGLPATPGAFQPKPVGNGDVFAFVSKLNATGSALVYSTYLGCGDVAHGIAVDASGNAYITGITISSDFPTTPGAFQTSLKGSESAFVIKLNPAGSGLVYSTYLGGSQYDRGFGIALDASGNAYVTGMTGSPDFPVTPGAFQSAPQGSASAFVSKLNANGSALVYSTHLGGGAFEGGYSIAVDSSNNAYLTGFTVSFNFPTTPGAFQTSLRGVEGAFVTKLNAAGSSLVYSTHLGGSYQEQGYGIAVDPSGNAYVTGRSSSSDFPTTPGAFQPNGEGGPFVAKFNATGSALIYSTYLGTGSGNSIAINSLGNAYITGAAGSFPITANAFQMVSGGGTDAFVAKLNVAGSALVYSTYLGGGDFDYGYGIAVDASGNAYVAGPSGSTYYFHMFPTTLGAFRTTSGGSDTFVSKLSLGMAIANFAGRLGKEGWYLGPVTVTFSATESTVSATYFSVDGAPYQTYVGPFSVTDDGIHQLSFYSVSTDGHGEKPQALTIKVDATIPSSHVAPLPATASSPNIGVQWSGTDTSGVHDCTIYVSDNYGPYNRWLNQTTASSGWFAGLLGHSYSFYSIARDSAGNQENPKLVAEATTHVPAQMPGDANNDGRINCADLAIVRASMGKSASQTGFDPRADVNHDGVVNVLDLAIVSQKLIPGTTCP